MKPQTHLVLFSCCIVFVIGWLQTTTLTHEYRLTDCRVIDGDTIRCIIHVGFNISYQSNIRLSGVNTPELASTNPEIRLEAGQARVLVEQWVANATVITLIAESRRDKYGRVLGEIFTDGESINKRLQARGWGYATTRTHHTDST